LCILLLLLIELINKRLNFFHFMVLSLFNG